jgi:hypothetical protein
MKFNYIFDKSYSEALEKLTEFFDETKSWDLVSKITFGPDDSIATELLVKNGLENLDNQIVNQLFKDIKFMGEFDSPEERGSQFKQHFCSTRLFDYMEDDKSKRMCQSAFNAIVNADGWDYFKSYTPNVEKGYMFDSDSQMNKLMNVVAEADPTHSGFTMGWTMRQLQQVALSGHV